MEIFNTIIGLGASVMMPIIFFILALVFGVKPGQAFKSGMLVGIGFVGVNMVINLLLDNLGPASEAMVTRLGLNLTVTDVGWATASTIGWGSTIMPAVVIGFFIINIVLLVLNVTKTVDIDIFNYWLFLLPGALMYAGTHNFWIAVGLTYVLFVLSLIFADVTAPYIQKQYNLNGISFPHLTCLTWVPFGIVANFIIEKIPGLNKIDLNPEKISEKFGVLGEPVSLGVILGIVIAVLAGYDVPRTLSFAVNIAASMLLLPKMIDILVSGLTIVRDAAEVRLKQWFPNREFYIGMDTALLIGEPSVLSTGLVLIPIAILLAFILPGNKVLPFADLASLMFLLSMVTPFCRRNMFRMIVAGTLILICIMYMGTIVAPEFTEAARMSNIALPEGIESITNLVGAATTWVGAIFVKLSELIAGLLI